MASRAATSRTPKPEPDWELVYKRNPVERIKRDKSPLGILDELPALIATGYDRVAEEDIVRMKWWGLYHDKPKIGTFMLRIKLPGGPRLAGRPARDRRDLEPLRPRRRRALDPAERPAPLARARLAPGGLRPAGRGRPDLGRRLRRRRSQHHRLPGRGARRRASSSTPSRWSTRRRSSSTATPTTRTCRASTRSRSRPAPTSATRPRSTASRSSASSTRACEGFAVRVGGGLSSVPRIARDLGVFVPKDEAIEVLARAARRLAGGPALPHLAGQVADEVHGGRLRPGGDARRRSRSASAGGWPTTTSRRSTRARRPPRRPRAEAAGLAYIGVPVHLGLMSGDQMLAVADLAESVGGDVRLTRQQNFVVTNVPEARVDEAVAALAEIGFPLDVNRVRGDLARLHRRAALQLRGHRDEDAARRARPAPRGALRRRDRRPEAPPRRLPARLRPPLGRRHRLPGHDRARRARRAAAGLRHLPARRPRPGLGDRAAGVPARADRGARRAVDGLVAGWLAARRRARSSARSATG